MSGQDEAASRLVLTAAAAFVGLDVRGAEVIRLGENALYLLSGGIVARIARPGQEEAAAKEVAVSQWLEDSGVAVVRIVRDIDQPVRVEGHAVTFWHELPNHEHGSPADVAVVLRRLHRVQLPTAFDLPELSPFVRVSERIHAASTVSVDDRTWMLDQLAKLRTRYDALPPELPRAVVHGDAWSGNVVRTADGRLVLLDLERCAVGPPEWDLVSTAVSRVTTGWMGAGEWAVFSDAYGRDVTRWDGFEVLRDIRELRMTSTACQFAASDPVRYGAQAAHRLACLRGQCGERPWSGWAAVP